MVWELSNFIFIVSKTTTLVLNQVKDLDVHGVLAKPIHVKRFAEEINKVFAVLDVL